MSKRKQISKTNVEYEALSLGRMILLRPRKSRIKGHRLTEKKLGRRKPPVKISAPKHHGHGCHLVGTMYDHEANTTTLIYDCNSAIDAAGHTSYTETVHGYVAGLSGS